MPCIKFKPHIIAQSPRKGLGDHFLTSQNQINASPSMPLMQDTICQAMRLLITVVVCKERQRRQCYGLGRDSTSYIQLVPLDGNLNSHINEILRPHVLSCTQRDGNAFIFQDDNSCLRRTRIVDTFLRQSHVTCLDWPA